MHRIQDRLFTIGSALASDPDKPKARIPALNESDVKSLEAGIDRMTDRLPPLKSFILPGGHVAASYCHIARCVCRRAERERWLYTLPPNVIGSGTVEIDEAMRAFMGPDEAEPAGPGEVRGLAASPGVARGVARVIRGLDEVDRLQRGDVLVTYATAPPWTPLFAVASAIVTDAGGPLSHAAVVSREYGIPAVVGTKAATARIEDGDVVTVDGSTGIVRIES